MIKNTLLSISFLILFISCVAAHIRGFEEQTSDQNTYLIVEKDKGGGQISEVYIDNELWPYAIGEKGKIEPGVHCISNIIEDCYISFEIKPSTIFHFNYWGP